MKKENLIEIIILILFVIAILMVISLSPGSRKRTYQGVYIDGEKDYCRRGRCSFGNCFIQDCLSGNTYSGQLSIKEIKGDIKLK